MVILVPISLLEMPRHLKEESELIDSQIEQYLSMSNTLNMYCTSFNTYEIRHLVEEINPGQSLPRLSLFTN